MTPTYEPEADVARWLATPPVQLGPDNNDEPIGPTARCGGCSHSVDGHSAEGCEAVVPRRVAIVGRSGIPATLTAAILENLGRGRCPCRVPWGGLDGPRDYEGARMEP